MLELIKTLLQKINELEKENKQLRIGYINLAIELAEEREKECN